MRVKEGVTPLSPVVCPNPKWVGVAYAVGVVSLVGLIAMLTAWELWLAPVQVGGSWAVLKVLPLLLALLGVLRGRVYTYQWLSMLSLLYFTEGVVRAWSDGRISSTSQTLAVVELVLSIALFVACLVFVRQHIGKRKRKY